MQSATRASGLAIRLGRAKRVGRVAQAPQAGASARLGGFTLGSRTEVSAVERVVEPLRLRLCAF
jgi:hypothetical protein